MCTDYCKLNAVTIRNTYPPPQMDEFIGSLGYMVVILTLGAIGGYWQMPVAKENKDETPFTSHAGA